MRSAIRDDVWRVIRCAAAATAISAAACGAQGAPRPSASSPASPAARQLDAFLRALRSGVVDSLERVLATRFTTEGRGGTPAEVAAAWRDEFARSGGYAVRIVDSAAIRRLVVRAQAATGLWARIAISVDTGAAARVTRLELRPVPAPDEARPPAAASLADAVRQLAAYTDRVAAANLFSGVVLVAADTGIAFARAYGLADRETRRPITLATPFNLASIGKSFTSVAVAQLVERGALAYDVPLGRYLPDLWDARLRERATVHHLLTHRSGLGDYFGTPRYAAERLRLNAVADYEALFRGDSLLFAPGTDVRYSNDGYVLLGALVERASGTMFLDHLARDVFDRSAMRDTRYLRLDSVAAARAAVGYTLRRGTPARVWPDGRRGNTDFLPARGGPAGGVYATAADLARFGHALLRGTLLGAESVARVTSAKLDEPAGPGLFAREAYGFFDERVRGERVISNNGGQAGVNTTLDIYPARRLVVVVLSNYDGPAAIAVSQHARALLIP